VSIVGSTAWSTHLTTLRTAVFTTTIMSCTALTSLIRIFLMSFMINNCSWSFVIIYDVVFIYFLFFLLLVSLIVACIYDSGVIITVRHCVLSFRLLVLTCCAFLVPIYFHWTLHSHSLNRPDLLRYCWRCEMYVFLDFLHFIRFVFSESWLCLEQI
jgi:hypothetical protein